MFRAFCILSWLTISIATVLSADGIRRKVDPPPMAPGKSPMELSVARIKSMEGPTNWGDLTVDPANARAFTLEDHPTWRADCYITNEGSIVIMWELRSDGSLAPGIYRIDDMGAIHGEWGHATDTRIDEAGKLVGNVRPDRVYRVEPPLPDDF